MDNNAVLERREYSRHHINLDVCVTHENSNKENIKSHIINMSLLGCAIEPNGYYFEEQEKLSICFLAAKQDCSTLTTINVKVCYVCDEYIGLCFETMGADVINLLRDLLKDAKYF